MNGILSIVDILIKIGIAGFGTFVFLHVFRNMKRRNLREEISKIEAKMSTLRISLQNRVKKKAKRFRATYPQSITQGDPIDISINQLSGLTFERNNDFQDYIDLCKKINSFIDLANADKADGSTSDVKPNDGSDFMGTDFKNEINIVRVINDMIMISRALNKQLNKLYTFERRSKNNIPEPISFPSLFELQKVFKNGHAADENEKSQPGVEHNRSA